MTEAETFELLEQLEQRNRPEIVPPPTSPSVIAAPYRGHDRDGVPFTIPAHAEWRGEQGRLYLDGEPFPYATVHPPLVRSHLPLPISGKAPEVHIIYVPVAVHGPVDVSGRRTDPAEPDDGVYGHPR